MKVREVSKVIGENGNNAPKKDPEGWGFVAFFLGVTTGIFIYFTNMLVK